jgi:hypothetical protein
MNQQRESQSREKEIFLFRTLQVLHQKIETGHAPKESERIYPTLLRVMDMISHQG